MFGIMDAMTAERATGLLFDRYIAILEAAGDDGIVDETSNAHLGWMCREARARLGDWPLDKASRWLGFIQGVMAARGILSVQDERNFSRPLFHAAYTSEGRNIPQTLDRTSPDSGPDLSP